MYRSFLSLCKGRDDAVFGRSFISMMTYFPRHKLWDLSCALMEMSQQRFVASPNAKCQQQQS